MENIRTEESVNDGQTFHLTTDDELVAESSDLMPAATGYGNAGAAAAVHKAAGKKGFAAGGGYAAGGGKGRGQFFVIFEMY